jgi:hypothetical protein
VAEKGTAKKTQSLYRDIGRFESVYLWDRIQNQDTLWLKFFPSFCLFMGVSVDVRAFLEGLVSRPARARQKKTVTVK